METREISETWRENTLLSLEIIDAGSPISPPETICGFPSSMQLSLDSLASTHETHPGLPLSTSHSSQPDLLACSSLLGPTYSHCHTFALSLKHPRPFCTGLKLLYHPRLPLKTTCLHSGIKVKPDFLEYIQRFLYFLWLLSVLFFPSL